MSLPIMEINKKTLFSKGVFVMVCYSIQEEVFGLSKELLQRQAANCFRSSFPKVV